MFLKNTSGFFGCPLRAAKPFTHERKKNEITVNRTIHKESLNSFKLLFSISQRNRDGKRVLCCFNVIKYIYFNFLISIVGLFNCSVLIFPPVNSYRRFLIHKVCESITANQPRALSTFSIGTGDQRRTVICHRYQLLVDLKTVSLKRFVVSPN